MARPNAFVNKNSLQRRRIEARTLDSSVRSLVTTPTQLPQYKVQYGVEKPLSLLSYTECSHLLSVCRSGFKGKHAFTVSAMYK
jgi:hypothetical protein